jgi:purine-binding chemotaxis protein CheW
LLVVQTAGRTVGLIVDGAREFQSIDPGVIKPPNENVTGLSGRYLKGIATLGDRLIMVINVEGLLDPSELDAAADTATRSAQE